MAIVQKLRHPPTPHETYHLRRQETPAAQLRNAYGLDRKLFSRLTGLSERAIASGRMEKRGGTPRRARVTEIQRLQQALARVMNVEFVRPWLRTPNPAFNDLRPIELIERGEIDRIWRMIRMLEGNWPG
jgi:hypothetical protein